MFEYRGGTIFKNIPEVIKFLITIAIAITSFMSRRIWVLALVLAVTIVLVIMAEFSFSDFKRFLFGMIPLIFISNIFFFFMLRGVYPDVIGLIIKLDLRLFIVFLAFSFFTRTTDLISVYRMLKFLRLPRFIVIPFYIVLRFLPELEKSYSEIRQIQGLRGITTKRPIVYLKSIFVPVISVILDRAEELSIAFYLKQEENKDIKF
jgi:energy-coupling factor transport system permease protein